MVTPQVDPAARLTTFTCTGTLTPAEVAHAIRDFYQGQPTLHTIWDFSAADLDQLKAADISHLAGIVKSASHSRAGGRAALVFPLPKLMELGDRLESLAEIQVAEAKIKIFDALDKAQAWVREAQGA